MTVKQKIKKSILFLLIGAMSVFYIGVFMDEDTSITYLPKEKELEDLHKNRIDQRINEHLDQLTRKVQLQKLRAKSVAKEMELLKISSPRLRYDQSDIDQEGDNNGLETRSYKRKNLTERIDAHINDMELEARQQAARQQEEEEHKRELIKSYHERAKKAGFEMVIRDGQIISVQKKKYLLNIFLNFSSVIFSK